MPSIESCNGTASKPKDYVNPVSVSSHVRGAVLLLLAEWSWHCSREVCAVDTKRAC